MAEKSEFIAGLQLSGGGRRLWLLCGPVFLAATGGLSSWSFRDERLDFVSYALGYIGLTVFRVLGGGRLRSASLRLSVKLFAVLPLVGCAVLSLLAWPGILRAFRDASVTYPCRARLHYTCQATYAPGGTFFFEEVTSAALERWSYRVFLRHPDGNRFSEAEFIDTLAVNGLRCLAPCQRILFGDIFIGVAKKPEANTRTQ